ncbi:MAG: hypothetical protein ABWX73_00460, partial [Marmoricola sp.]
MPADAPHPRPARAGTASVLHYVLWSLTVVLVAVSWVLPQERILVQDDAFEGWVLAGLLTVQALTFATVGLVISRAHPRHAIGWMFAVVGLFVGFYLAAERYQYLALVVRDGDLPLGELAAWLQAWTYVPALAIVVMVLPQIFPTGRPLSRRWSVGLVLAALALVGVAATDALAPGVIDQTVVENPLGLSAERHASLKELASSLYLVATLVGFASFVARWRRADRRERQQLKLFAYAAALLPVFVLASAVADATDVGPGLPDVALFVIAAGAFLGLPIATAASILRHRLYDIDLVINRTLVYAVLTTLLVATYLVSVLAFRLVLDPLTGQSDLAVAASTLAVAGLFRPLRGRVQAEVDRRFYRSRYNAARTLETFADRLRHRVDL